MAKNTYSLDLETGSNQYAYCDDSASLSITGNLTMEAWIKRESVNAVSIVMGKWSVADGNHSYLLTFEADNDLVFYVDDDGTGGTGVTWTTPSVPVATWTHVAVAYTASSGGAELFINGSSVSTKTGLPTSIFDGNSKFRLGYPSTSFDGLIDEVRVWNDVRSEAEIAANMYKCTSIFTSGVDNFVDGWELNNSYASRSGSNDLTPDASPVFSTDVPFTGGGAKLDLTSKRW